MHAASYGPQGEEGAAQRQAEALLASGDLQAAREVLEALVSQGHVDGRTRGLLGLCYFKSGLLQQSAELYAALVRENPDDATLRVNLGLVALKSGRLDVAVDNLREAVRLVPGHRKALNYLGLALAQRGDAAEAREAFLLAGSAPMAAKMERVLAGLEPGADARAQERAPAAEEARVFPAPDERAAPVAARPAPSPQPAARSGGLDGSWDEAVAAPAQPAARQVEIVTFPDRRPDRAPEPEADSAALALAAALEDEPPAPPEAAEEPVPAAPEPAAEPPAAVEPAVAEPALAEPVREPPPRVRHVGPLERFAAAHPLAWADGRPFALTPEGNAVVEFAAEIHVRLEGLIAARGDTAWMPVFKRFRGRVTERPFGNGHRQMWQASGGGKLLFATQLGGTSRTFTPLELDGEIYLVEDRVFAFADTFEFENGRLPGQTQDLPLVRMSGAGQVLLTTERALRCESLRADDCLSLPATGLVGWAGAINPRLVSAEEGPAVPWVELVGEGTVLLVG